MHCIILIFRYIKKNAHNKTILTLDWNPVDDCVLVIF